MGSTSSAILAERSSALNLLKQLFADMSSNNIYFGYSGNTYEYLGKYSDGTIKALDITTGQITTQGALDPINVVASNASTIQSQLDPTTAGTGTTGGSSLLSTGVSLAGAGGQILTATRTGKAPTGQQGGGGVGTTPFNEQIFGLNQNQPFNASSITSLQNAQAAANAAANQLAAAKQTFENINGPANEFFSKYPTADGYIQSQLDLQQQSWKSVTDTYNNASDLVTLRQNQLNTAQEVADQAWLDNGAGAKFSEAETSVSQAQFNLTQAQQNLGTAQSAYDKLPAQALDPQGPDYEASSEIFSDKYYAAKTALDNATNNYAIAQANNANTQALYASYKDTITQATSITATVDPLTLTPTFSASNAAWNPSTSEIIQAEMQVPQGNLDATQWANKVAAQIAQNRQSILSAPPSQTEWDQALQTTVETKLDVTASDYNDFFKSDLQDFLKNNPNPSDQAIQNFLTDEYDYSDQAELLQDVQAVKNLNQNTFQQVAATREQTIVSNADAFDQQKFQSDELKGGIALLSAGATAYGFENVAEGIFENGASFKSIAELAGLGAGLYGSLHYLNSFVSQMQTWMDAGLNPNGIIGSFLKSGPGSLFMRGLNFLSTPLGTLAVFGALLAIAYLFARKSISAEQQAAENMLQAISPTVWNDGGVYMISPGALLAGGLTLASMGIMVGPTAGPNFSRPAMETNLVQALSSATGSSISPGSSLYGATFVLAGSGSTPTEVLYVTPDGTDSKGNTIDMVHVATLKSNVTFATSQPTSYIPFFIKDSNGNPIPNPVATNNVEDQQQMVKCADGTVVPIASAQACASHGGTDSHVTN